MDLESALLQLNIPFKRGGEHHHVRHGWLGLDCPWCSPHSGRYRLGVSLTSHATTCWVCGKHRLWDILERLAGRPAAARVFSGLKRFDRQEVAPNRPQGQLTLPPKVGPLLRPHRDYLRSRRFFPTRLERLWGLRGIGVSTSEWAWRLFIPITLDGKAVSWTTRKVGGEDGPRYRNAPPEMETVRAKTLLLGEEYCRGAVVICEGPFDAFRIGPGAVATMGLGHTEEQLYRASRHPVRVVCFDSEPDAQRRARQLCNDLAAFPGTTHRVEVNAADPGEMSRREVEKLRRAFLE